eukprot:Lankesteria_metandrocarpae@DN5149_c0_g1_i1.p1
MDKGSLKWRCAKFGLVCVQVALAGALCNGWPGAKRIFMREGIYLDQCDNTAFTAEEWADHGFVNCDARKQNFVKVYSSAFSATRWGLLLAGLLLRPLPPKLTNFAALAGVMYGLISVAYSSKDLSILSHDSLPTTANGFNPVALSRRLSSMYDTYILPTAAPKEYTVRSFVGMAELEFGMSVIGFFGTCLYSTSLHAANLFPSSRKLAMSIIAASLGLSPVVFLLLDAIHEKTGLHSSDLYFCLMALCGIVAVLGLLVHPWGPVPSVPCGSKTKVKPIKSPPRTGKRAGNSGATSPLKSPGASTGKNELENTTMLSDMMTPQFWSLVASFSVTFLLLNFYIASYQNRLIELGDQDNATGWWCALLLPAGPLLVPLYGLFLEAFDVLAGAALLHIAVASMLIMASSPILKLQIGTSFLYSLSRSMTSTLQLAHFSYFFGGDRMTVLYGLSSPMNGSATAYFTPVLEGLSGLYSLQTLYKCLPIILLLSLPSYFLKPIRS